jgi:phosphatidylserine/phosphatidylglycerophosphate/cardiolipin synthase-like enzyme
MEVCEEDFPEHYRPIIRQIKQATESIDIRYRMDMEADILEEMEEIK